MRGKKSHHELHAPAREYLRMATTAGSAGGDLSGTLRDGGRVNITSEERGDSGNISCVIVQRVLRGFCTTIGCVGAFVPGLIIAVCFLQTGV